MTQEANRPDPAGALSNQVRAVQQFISDTLTERPDRLYPLDDFGAIRQQLFDNVKTAVQRRFPMRNDRYTLAVEDVDYDDPEDIGADEQKRLLLEGGSSVRRLRGRWVLRRASDDSVVSRSKRMTLMRVPRMTDRGTFIKGGREFAMTNIMRLVPGVYCKGKDDEVTAQFNIRQGTGSGFSMVLTPSTGIFQFRRGTTNAPAYTVLHDFGVSDETMKKAWGDELFETNRTAGTGERARQAAAKLYGTA